MAKIGGYILRHHGDETPAFCQKCQQNKLPSEFYSHSVRKDGAIRYRPICKSCRCVGGRSHWSRPVHTEIIKTGKQVCCFCSTEKPISEFYSNGCFADGVRKYRTRCKACVLEISKREFPGIYRRKSQIRSSSPKNYIAGLLNHAASRKQHLGFNLDIQFLLDMYESQKGLCAISGEKMTFLAGHGRIETNISIDRIDSDQGYVRDNVQLVCLAVNLMKQRLSTHGLVTWCQRIMEHQRAKI